MLQIGPKEGVPLTEKKKALVSSQTNLVIRVVRGKRAHKAAKAKRVIAFARGKQIILGRKAT